MPTSNFCRSSTSCSLASLAHVDDGCRSEDLPPHIRAERDFHSVIMIIPPRSGMPNQAQGATSQPSKLAAYLSIILQELQELGPTGRPRQILLMHNGGLNPPAAARHNPTRCASSHVLHPLSMQVLGALSGLL
jgi:hypothetical protein